VKAEAAASVIKAKPICRDYACQARRRDARPENATAEAANAHLVQEVGV
jgi:hypothetical protein